MNRLRLFRRCVGLLFLLVATLLFLDFTGTIHSYFGWVAKVQFLPALMALNAMVIVALVALTLIFGRLYCSVICPLGLFQDVVSRFASLSDKRRKLKYSPAMSILRYTILALFIASFIVGLGAIVALLEPYGAFGRMISTLVGPLYKMGNNILAGFAQRADSYSFYSVDVIWSGVGVITISAITFIVVTILAWRNGRTYCNTICPVGTLLGTLSKFSLFKIRVDESKCNGCRKCVRSCKSACITPETRAIDYSRCIVCFNCIDSCNQGAIGYTLRRAATQSESKDKGEVDSSKRSMLAISSALLTTTALKAEGKLVDGGLAVIENKQIPERKVAVVPAGAMSLKNFTKRCVGCQLCVTVCPNGVLRPSSDLSRFMQPESSFERGFCRPECTKCSEVCPAGAIAPIERSEKSSIQVGVATLIRQNCVVLTDGVDCGSCATHCPSGAITMVEATDKELYGERKIPVVDPTRCIGCGACEYLCPARPFSAIYVEGVHKHKTI